MDKSESLWTVTGQVKKIHRNFIEFCIEPYTDSQEDVEAAERQMVFSLGWWAGTSIVRGAHEIEDL